MRNQFTTQANKGFAILEAFLVIAFSLLVAVWAVLSIVEYRRDANLNNEITDVQQFITNMASVSTTSSSWIPPNTTDTNPFDILGAANALPYSIQSQYVANQTSYMSRLGGSIQSTITGASNNQLTVTLNNISAQDCNRVADAMMLPGIESLTINGVNQTLGPTGTLSSRDPTAATYDTSCTQNNSTLIFTYLKPNLNINSDIIDLPFTDPRIIAGPGSTKQTGVGIVANGSGGYIMQGPNMPLDPGMYQARIYANDVQASVDVELQSISAAGVPTTVFYTTDQNSPRGPLIGTNQYIQGLGLVPNASNTSANSQTFTINFTLTQEANEINFTVNAANGSPITISQWTIYPVNPLSTTIQNE
jgi:hypothetical protein